MALGFGGGFGFQVNHDLLAAGAGVLGGGIQVIATQTLDANGTLGAPYVSGLTNGQLINAATGVPTLLAGTYGVLKSSSRIGQHRGLSGALLGYGATTVVAGVVVPLAVKALAPGSAGGARGGRYAGGSGFPGNQQRSNATAANLSPAAVSNSELSSSLNS